MVTYIYSKQDISTKDASKQKTKKLNTSLIPIVYNFIKFGPRFTFMNPYSL
jgi:hypothetical protein